MFDLSKRRFKISLYNLELCDLITPVYLEHLLIVAKHSLRMKELDNINTRNQVVQNSVKPLNISNRTVFIDISNVHTMLDLS